MSNNSFPIPQLAAPDSNAELQQYDNTTLHTNNSSSHSDAINATGSSDSVEKGRISSATSISPSKKEGAKMNVVDHSVRRADGSLAEKQPTWSRIKHIEARRLRILKRVSSFIHSFIQGMHDLK